MFNSEKLETFYLQLIKVGSLVIIFLPLFAYERFVFPFVFPRTILFRLIIELLLVAYISLALIKPKYRPRWSVLLGLIASFVGIMALASVLGADLYHSFWSSIERSEGIIAWLHFLAFFVILISVFREKKDWLLLLNGVVLAGWLQALYALMQYFNFPLALQYGGGRIGGSIGNASFLATYIIFVIFIAAFLSTQYKEYKFKIYYGLFILVNIFILWHTRTRGAILALLFSLLVLLTIWLWQKKTRRTKSLVIAVWLGLIIIGSILIVNKNATWVESSNTLSRLANISTTDITTQNRFIVWGVGLKGFIERPALGWGWENFNVPFNRYFDPAITRDIGSQPWYDRAHNVIVETAVNTGAIGLLFYLSMLAWPVVLLLKHKKKKPLPLGNRLLATLMLAYFLQNLFVFDTLNSYILLFLILAYIQVNYAKTRPVKRKIITRATASYKYAIIAPLGLIIFFVGTAFYFNVRPVLANYYIVKAVTENKNDIFLTGQNFTKAFQYSPPNDQELRFILVQYTRDLTGRYGITQGTLPQMQLAIQEMEKSVAASPETIQNYLLLAELYLAALPLDETYLAKAEDLMYQAQAKAPSRYQILTMLGRLAMEKGNFEQGVEYFQNAIALNDQFAEAHWNLAMAHVLSGNFDQVQTLLDQARDLKLPIDQPQYQNMLLRAYRDSKDLKATIDYLQTLTEQHPDNEAYRDNLQSLLDLYNQVLEKAEELK